MNQVGDDLANPPKVGIDRDHEAISTACAQRLR